MNQQVQLSIPTYWERIKIAMQYLMPQFLLTRLAGWFARKQWGWVTKWVITLFVRYYHVNMNEAEKPNIADYRSFNQFFIRPLAKGTRPIDQTEQGLCFPADGKISQFGNIEQHRLLQAKGHYFHLNDLVAHDKALISLFEHGHFLTTYLSPRDYHRVHMPCKGILRKMIYVPGELFSVNPFLNKHIPNMFARNERVVCEFDTEFGTMVQILVGATITASISTTWAGIINPPREHKIKTWTYPSEGEHIITLEKGQEMGAFQLGSTVITLFQANQIQFARNLTEESAVKMGEFLAIKSH